MSDDGQIQQTTPSSLALVSNVNSTELTQEQKTIAVRALLEQLHINEGIISVSQLKSVLREITGTREDVIIDSYIKFLKFNKCFEIESKEYKWTHAGRSFYSTERYEKEIAEEENTGEIEIDSEPQDLNQEYARTNNREEARLCRYVKTALEEIYDSNSAPEEFVFDVHDERPNGEFRNVDLVAVNWRSQAHYEVVSVEVKLDFSNKLVQQAAVYTRFSHRVWIAVPIESNIDITSALNYLKTQDELLFDIVVDLGLGILACRKAKGKSYEVYPIQWPRLQRPTQLELDHFIESYSNSFISSDVIEIKTNRIKRKSAV